MGWKHSYGHGHHGDNGYHDNVGGACGRGHGCGGNDNNVETVYYPTRNEVKNTTNRRTVRRVHPTHVRNVNKNITRVENYYPVTESTENENFVQEYNCGNDLNRPNCKPVNDCNRCKW